MLSVETHLLHLKTIRLLAISVMIVNSVSSAFIISLLLTTRLIHLQLGMVTPPYPRTAIAKPQWNVLDLKSEVGSVWYLHPILASLIDLLFFLLLYFNHIYVELHCV